MDIAKLVDQVIKDGGNEILLKAGSVPLMRKHKVLSRMKFPALMAEDVNNAMEVLLTPAEIKKCLSNSFSEVNVFGKLSTNVRVSVLMTLEKPMLTIRIIENEVPDIKTLGFPEFLMPLVESRKGLFIVSGPARSGISTTISSISDYLNRQLGRHLLLIEDPIAYNINPVKSRVTQCQIGKDILDFNSGLNFAKKMDVDTIIISDMKQNISYSGVLEMVASGNMVVLAMSAFGIVATLEKFVLDFPEDSHSYVYQVLAENLLGIESQTLITANMGSTLVPLFETLVVNAAASGIIQKGKPGQLEGSINSCGPGSMLFTDCANMMVARNKLDRQSADTFLEYYRSTKV